jgi:hypothetical protein
VVSGEVFNDSKLIGLDHIPFLSGLANIPVQAREQIPSPSKKESSVYFAAFTK